MKNKNVQVLKFNPIIKYLGQWWNLMLRKGRACNNKHVQDFRHHLQCL